MRTSAQLNTLDNLISKAIKINRKLYKLAIETRAYNPNQAIFRNTTRLRYRGSYQSNCNHPKKTNYRPKLIDLTNLIKGKNYLRKLEKK